MPNMNGLDFLRALRRQALNYPFILMTAEGSEALAIEAFRAGANDYFNKPLDFDLFLERLRYWLQQAPKVAPYLDTIGDLVFVTDKQERLRYANPAARALFGWTDEMLGRPLEKLPSPAELLEALKHPKSQFTTSDKRIFNLHNWLSPQGERISLVQDMTALENVNRAKSDFIMSFSHDLRSPLTTILGYVELIERVGPLNETQKRYTENITFSVRTITALLSDLLELYRIESSPTQNFEPSQIELVLRYALEPLRTSLEEKQQKLEVDFTPDLPPVMGNPIRLKQMLVNLLQNAIKYTPEKGTISVKGYLEDGFIYIEVRDTGIGIPLEEQSLIWEKFYRAKAIVDDFPGTGLGLSIVKSIVDAHGGRIWLESVPQEGSTFIIMLPVFRPYEPLSSAP
jgi:two-component system NtrC family sensor kinase